MFGFLGNSVLDPLVFLYLVRWGAFKDGLVDCTYYGNDSDDSSRRVLVQPQGVVGYPLA
jgi:hypothetical protein